MGVLLVSIPLCFEITIFGVLIGMQDHLENEAQRINHNKVINDKVNVILRDTVLINNALQLNTSLSAMSAFKSKDIQVLISNIRQSFLDLQDLVHDDPELLRSVKKCEEGLGLAFQDIKALKDGVRSSHSIKEVQRVISETKTHLEQHLYLTLRGGIFELALRSAQGNEEDLVTEQIEEQKKRLLKCALVLSGCFAILGAYVLSKYLVRRLALVSRNAERLGKGQPLLPALTGTDEVAELDRNFHTAAELIEAAKKMRQEVTAMITHDLKSPLQSVRSYLELLEHGRFGPINETGTRLLSTAQKSTNQMASLIDNVLQLEKLRSGLVRLEATQIELPRLVDQCLDAVQLLAEQKNVAFTRNYEGTGCDTTTGDPFWLEQVIVNILSNAIKFTPSDSTVSVTTRSRSPGYVEVCIADQGPGIAAQEMKLIFDRFHRVESTAQVAGTGLGLPIAKELIELQHGAISVESEKGKGSTFVLRLPVSDPDTAVPTMNFLTQQSAKDTAAKETDQRQDPDTSEQLSEQLGSHESELEAKKFVDEGDQLREFAFRGQRKLRLLHKGLILISIPLCFEIGIFASLMSLQNEVEQEAQRISGFKKFNDNANLVERNLIYLATAHRKQKLSEFVNDPRINGCFAEMQKGFRECKRLADRPQVAQYVQETEDGVNILVAMIVHYRQELHDGTYDRHEHLEQISTQLNEVFTKSVLRLGNRSISPKYLFRSTELREQSRLLLRCALGFSVFFAVMAAMIYQRNLVGRLNRVRDNANRLAQGEPLLQTLGGTDEIAELDATVHYAAGLIEAAKKMRQEATAMITHDLKTPLQSVCNYFEMIEHGALGELNERGIRLLGIGQRALQHMADLINSVLQLEKLRTGSVSLQLSPLQLSALLDRCLDSIKLLAGQKNIAIVHEFNQCESAQIDGDAFWLEQVFGNVLSNAIKFSPENSTIFVDLKKQDHVLEVRITDQGPGIPEKDLALVFDRYHRVESTAGVPGTGLGLPIAKELVDLHHGSIKAESVLGSGATFSIALPLAKQTME
jgi:signal transduction histidine kinase